VDLLQPAHRFATVIIWNVLVNFLTVGGLCLFLAQGNGKVSCCRWIEIKYVKEYVDETIKSNRVSAGICAGRRTKALNTARKQGVP
jgi:hypothetical protein